MLFTYDMTNALVETLSEHATALAGMLMDTIADQAGLDDEKYRARRVLYSLLYNSLYEQLAGGDPVVIDAERWAENMGLDVDELNEALAKAAASDDWFDDLTWYPEVSIVEQEAV